MSSQQSTSSSQKEDVTMTDAELEEDGEVEEGAT